jgi:hypothetical protein
VYEGPDGALKAEPEEIDLPTEATSLALGQMDASYEMDLAIAAGNELIVAHGRDRGGYNIYISTTEPVQTVPANLWRTVPATNTASAPAAPAGSFYVVTTLYNCNGMIVESGSSNQVGVPAGPTIRSVSVGGKIKVKGNGFSEGAEVFIDGVGFTKQAGGGGSAIKQKGRLTDGRRIAEAVPSGRAVLFSVRNTNGGISSLSFTQP